MSVGASDEEGAIDRGRSLHNTYSTTNPQHTTNSSRSQPPSVYRNHHHAYSRSRVQNRQYMSSTSSISSDDSAIARSTKSTSSSVSSRSSTFSRKTFNNNGLMPSSTTTNGLYESVLGTPIFWQGLRFLICECPTDSNLHYYIKEFQKHHVTDVVRVCESTYQSTRLQQHQIQVHDLAFRDGHIPPENIIITFLRLVDSRFCLYPSTSKGVNGEIGGMSMSKVVLTGDAIEMESSIHMDGSDDLPVIAIHCVAGLGRAPILVALALVEAGMDALSVIELIRTRRPGALNTVQVRYLIDTHKRYGPNMIRGWGNEENAYGRRKPGLLKKIVGKFMAMSSSPNNVHAIRKRNEREIHIAQEGLILDSKEDAADDGDVEMKSNEREFIMYTNGLLPPGIMGVVI